MATVACKRIFRLHVKTGACHAAFTPAITNFSTVVTNNPGSGGTLINVTGVDNIPTTPFRAVAANLETIVITNVSGLTLTAVRGVAGTPVSITPGTIITAMGKVLGIDILTLTDASTSSHPIVSRTWKVGAQVIGSGMTHQMQSIGNDHYLCEWPVTLTIVDDSGCTDSVTHTVSIISTIAFTVPPHGGYSSPDIDAIIALYGPMDSGEWSLDYTSGNQCKNTNPIAITWQIVVAYDFFSFTAVYRKTGASTSGAGVYTFYAGTQPPGYPTITVA